MGHDDSMAIPIRRDFEDHAVVGHRLTEAAEQERFGPLLGNSEPMRHIFDLLRRVAPTKMTCLLQGESGTGKDATAQAIHEASRRAEGPFVVVDCGAIPRHLVESELYGHMRGAFTGADQTRYGAFDRAKGGTILLNEIGDLPLEVQPSLLRVLESREVKPLGADGYHPVEVRVIAATCRDLFTDIAAGQFREDLFYRLDVISVELPPLRDRREDIPALVHHFSAISDDGETFDSISDELLAALVEHHWPGNIRELRNVVSRLQVMPELGLSALSAPRQGQASDHDEELTNLLETPYRTARKAWLDRFELAYVRTALGAADGVVAAAARQSGVSRQTFNNLMNKHRLSIRGIKPYLVAKPS